MTGRICVCRPFSQGGVNSVPSDERRDGIHSGLDLGEISIIPALYLHCNRREKGIFIGKSGAVIRSTARRTCSVTCLVRATDYILAILHGN